MHRDTSSLIVIPDGPLHLVPFSALVNEARRIPQQRSEPNCSAFRLDLLHPEHRTEKAVATGAEASPGVAFSPPAESGQNGQPRRLAGLQICVPGVSSRSVSRVRRLTEAAKVFGPQSVMLDGSQASEAAVKSKTIGGL